MVVKPNTAWLGGLAIEKWSRSHREGRPNTAGGLGEAGSVLPSKSGPEPPLCILLFCLATLISSFLVASRAKRVF